MVHVCFRRLIVSEIENIIWHNFVILYHYCPHSMLCLANSIFSTIFWKKKTVWMAMAIAQKTLIASEINFASRYRNIEQCHYNNNTQLHSNGGNVLNRLCHLFRLIHCSPKPEIDRNFFFVCCSFIHCTCVRSSICRWFISNEMVSLGTCACASRTRHTVRNFHIY